MVHPPHQKRQHLSADLFWDGHFEDSVIMWRVRMHGYSKRNSGNKSFGFHILVLMWIKLAGLRGPISKQLEYG